MILISHRGNISGIEKENENNPTYIDNALFKGFDVEVDVRYENNDFFLGHDFNQYKVNEKFLLKSGIWCHAKTKSALEALNKISAHYFWHQEDDYTITSKGFIWTYPGKKLLDNSICVLPELANYKEINCTGICSDFIQNYKK
jgi:hypothetical protein